MKNVEWRPETRAEKNVARRFDQWRVVRRDAAGNVLLVPLERDGQPDFQSRIWVAGNQISAGVAASEQQQC